MAETIGDASTCMKKHKQFAVIERTASLQKVKRNFLKNFVWAGWHWLKQFIVSDLICKMSHLSFKIKKTMKTIKAGSITWFDWTIHMIYPQNTILSY